MEQRINLGMNEELYVELRRLAEEDGSTITEMIRKFVKLGFVLYKAQKLGKQILIRDKEDKEMRIIIL